MKNILFLTDFSENSINAMRYALELFKDDICIFYILHVQSSSSYISDDLMLTGNKSIYDSIVKKAKDKLIKLVVSLESEFKNDNFLFETLVDYDGLTDAVKQVVKAKKIDLIVMGTNGVTGAKEVVFGSNTINVVRDTDCPVLVIPNAFKFKVPKEVLLPLDLFDSMYGEAFLEVVNFTNRFSKILHVLRIKPQNEAFKKAKKDKESLDNSSSKISHKYHVIRNVPINYAVSCYTQVNDIDLTVLLVQKESFFERFFIGSPTTQIANEIKKPLLIFHSN